MSKTRVHVGRAYDEPTDQDGTRVLVDRLWPRGLTKAKAGLDEWCKQIAPSTELRRWYGHDPARFPEQLKLVQPWQPKRLFWNNWRPKLEGRTASEPALVTLDLGAYSPRLGRSWTEIAAETRYAGP